MPAGLDMFSADIPQSVKLFACILWDRADYVHGDAF